MFIIFALSIKPKGYEREGAAKILASIEEEINKLVEILKEL